jgi:hypothetical protein
MKWTKELIEEKMTVEKVSTLLLALEIIVNGDPIAIGLDEVTEICQTALDLFEGD